MTNSNKQPAAWRRFYASLAITAALGGFSLWRAEMTVWRPTEARYYLFPPESALGYVERCWLNDTLYALGMAGILYVLYTAKELLSGEAEPDAELTRERWCDHQQRSKLMIGVGLVIVLLWAWLEEVADLVPGYIFDKWDLSAIFLGFLLGWSVVQRLPYPVFRAHPAFRFDTCDPSLGLADLNRFLCFAFVAGYTALVEPVTMADRWSHMAELGFLILGCTLLLSADRSRRPAGQGIQLASLAP